MDTGQRRNVMKVVRGTNREFQYRNTGWPKVATHV
jgi:hypothetical protein